jgi:hypothetical protein
MAHSAISTDTSHEAFGVMCQRWAAMSTVDRGELFSALCLHVDEIARLGIAATEGDVSPEREHFLLMERRYGTALATTVLGNPPLR